MEVEIVKLDNYGRGIAYINDKICFIENVLPEEMVKINIIKEKKKYLEGEVVEYIKLSNKRIKEECPYSKICGGCNLNHLSLKDENIFKEQKVKEIINKFTDINSNLIESIKYSDRNNYRNKITLHGKNNKLGLYKKNTNEIIEIDKCLLVDNRINEVISLLKKINNGIKEVTIKVSNNSKELMINIIGDVKDTKELLEISDVLIINNKYLTPKKEIISKIGDKSYYVGINSFFQVNKYLTKELYDEVLSIVKNNNYNNVLDLYCGTGTIGVYISEYCNKIIGIDYNESNINDANKNKELNNCHNIEFICDKVENRVNSFKDIDLVIVDPPRAGLDKKTRAYLKDINPKKIIYISCDPVTLSRDLKELNTNYNIKKIIPFNMFSRTYHCETIAVLERK